MLKLPHSQVSQQLGKDTLLECIIHSSPHEEMHWEKDGVQLVNNAKYQIYVWEVSGHKKNLVALVRSLEASDYGEYTCVAENQYGTARDTVTIYGKPFHCYLPFGLLEF